MPVRKPATFSAGRKITIGGTTYQPGDAVPNAVVKDLPRLGAMLSNGMLISDIDPYSRKSKATTHDPTYLNPTTRKAL